MDRTLVAETPPLYASANRLVQQWDMDTPAEWRTVGTVTTNQFWLHESTIDLGGYTRQDDLTVYFRASFEQKNGVYTAAWMANDTAPENNLNGFDAAIQEITIISSVPINDEQIVYTIIQAPGFTMAQNAAFALDFGNFDRTHIIHGRRIDHTLSSTFGASVFTREGQGFMMPIDTCEFSSLEPTAADTLYVYRLIGLPRPSIMDSTGLTLVAIPARRIILDATVDEESNLAYMMRLKRSYELANQV